MNFIKTSASLVFAATVAGLVASPAMAGSTSNTWRNGTESTKTKVRVNNVRVEAGEFHRLTENLKIDAVTEPGGFAQSNINIQNGVFSGSGVANINNGVDPYVNAGRSLNIENGSFTDITTTKVNQETSAFDRVRVHTLDTGF